MSYRAMCVGETEKSPIAFILVDSLNFEVLFKKRVRGFHRVSKRKLETFEITRPQAEWFYCFRAFGNLMEPEARVFEVTSPAKRISLNHHLNKFSQFKYYT